MNKLLPLSVITFSFIVGTDGQDLVIYCRGDDISIQLQTIVGGEGPISYTIDDSGDELPCCLTLDTHSGLISGILQRTNGEGTSTGYDVKVAASNSKGTVLSTTTVPIFSIPCEEPVISRFVLVDTELDKDLMTLKDGAVINLGWQSGRFSIRVDTYPNVLEDTVGGEDSVVTSVRFYLDGTLLRTELAAPYLIGGDNMGDYHNFPIEAGDHTLSVEAIGSNGVEGPMQSIDFTIVA